MPHITLSIPEELLERMKRHPEIKWSEVARRAIRRYLMELEDEVSGEEILEELPKEIKEKIEKLDWKRFSERVVELRNHR